MLKLLKNIFSDIFILYKNILHFTISKIVILLSVIVLMFIFLIPSLIILVSVFFWLWLNNSLIPSNFWFFTILLLWFWLIVFILTIILFFISYWYSNLLLVKLNLKYLKWKKLDLSKNYYFNFKLFFKYLNVTLISYLFIFLPVLIFIIGSALFLLFFWWFSNPEVISWMVELNWLSVSILVLAILCIIGVIYMIYKTIFWVVILVSESKWKTFKSAYYYVKKSFSLTKWFKRFLKFLLVFLVILTFSSPIFITESIFESKVDGLEKYIDYKKWKLTDAEIWKNFYNLENLKLKYWNYDIEKLKKDLIFDNRFLILLYIFDFLFIYWIFQMMLVSFYKREIIKNEENNKEKTKEKNNKEETKEEKNNNKEETKEEFKKEHKEEKNNKNVTKKWKKDEDKKTEKKWKTKIPVKKNKKTTEIKEKKITKKVIENKTDKVKRKVWRPRKSEK